MDGFDVDESSGTRLLDERQEKLFLLFGSQVFTMSTTSLLIEEDFFSVCFKGDPHTPHGDGAHTNNTGNIRGRELLHQMKSNALHALHVSFCFRTLHPVLKLFGGDGRHTQSLLCINLKWKWYELSPAQLSPSRSTLRTVSSHTDFLGWFLR